MRRRLDCSGERYDRFVEKFFGRFKRPVSFGVADRLRHDAAPTSSERHDFRRSPAGDANAGCTRSVLSGAAVPTAEICIGSSSAYHAFRFHASVVVTMYALLLSRSSTGMRVGTWPADTQTPPRIRPPVACCGSAFRALSGRASAISTRFGQASTPHAAVRPKPVLPRRHTRWA